LWFARVKLDTTLRDSMSFKSKPQNPFEQQHAAAKRKALRQLRKAKRAADAGSVTLSEWEGEFLGSVEGRVEKYGRAFRDFEKGRPGTSLSIRQTVKLKEIAAKAKGVRKPWAKRRSPTRNMPSDLSEPEK
jgi:hypothetical protein